MKADEFEELFGARSEAEQAAEDALMLGFRFLSIIDRLMEERGMSKKSLAEKVGATPSYITQLFRGNVRVNLEFIAKAEKALGIRFQVGLDLKDVRMEGISLKESEKMMPESSPLDYLWDEVLESAENGPIAA